MILAALALTLAGPACDEGAVQLRTDFVGAGRHGCERTEKGFRLTVEPEATPINPSPWYAFDIISEDGGPVEVELVYLDSRHRYVPKKFAPGSAWHDPIPDRVELLDGGKRAVLRLDPEAGWTRYAAQMVFTSTHRLAHYEQFARGHGFEMDMWGMSGEGRPVPKITSAPETPGHPTVLLLGGQHPPEWTGTAAMSQFLNRIAGGDDLASEFREQYGLLIFPTLNPDGIDNGNWRFTMKGGDLNRDWGPFEQVESNLVLEALEALQPDRCLALMIDFHSTRRDVLYTPAPKANADPDDFLPRWIAHIDGAMGDEEGFDVSANHNPGLPTARTWFSETYGRPGVTLEIGDETEPLRIERLATAAAEAMMQTLLERPVTCD
ncbi:M14 family metallopeptidase [Sphingomicrobium sediminis]|uniref:M14 family metallopeptidase n=1 Tax=Sphingomicrobium sediminis TaxID=2950949 RepID=A0A9X2J2G1_9SPHN|nr:M14 family metallopeptidase [Sphingomicrobium sediminis]MCM8558233.1 M14 family metallopeptidase [Sphingomicrobium sediminis]